MIVTFYSYKGGVGRSMALASVATLLARTGLRVIVVDCDLEAPGLEHFFLDNNGCNEVKQHPGFVDLVGDFESALRSWSTPSDDNWRNLPSVERVDCIMNASWSQPSNFEGYLRDVKLDCLPSGSLRLLSAGCRANTAAYQDRVQLSWKSFLAERGGTAFIDWLRVQLRDRSDVVLVDSRTGLTEISGVCTHQLADAVIMLSPPNKLSFAGCKDVAKSILDYHGEAKSIEGPNRRGYGKWCPRIGLIWTRVPISGGASIAGEAARTESIKEWEEEGKGVPQEYRWDLGVAEVQQVESLSVGVPNVALQYLGPQANQGRDPYAQIEQDTGAKIALSIYHLLAGEVLRERERQREGGQPEPERSGDRVVESDSRGREFAIRIFHSRDAYADARLLATALRNWGGVVPASANASVFAQNPTVSLVDWSDRKRSVSEQQGITALDVRIVSDEYVRNDSCFDAALMRHQRAVRGTRLDEAGPQMVEEAVRASSGRSVFVVASQRDALNLLGKVPRDFIDGKLCLANGVQHVVGEVLRRGAGIDVFESEKGARGLTFGEGSKPGSFNPTITNGWDDQKSIAELLKLMNGRLKWQETTGSARKWWNAFISENQHRLPLVYRLAEELSWREATVTEFFLAYVYSNCDNIQANLHYLDYTRLKKEEERKKRQPMQGAGASEHDS
jgi:hypothetical protein